MTARLREAPARVMSRLATWADYGLAVALLLCRRLPLPQRTAAPVLVPAFEPVYAFEPCGCPVQPVRAAAVAPAPGRRNPAPAAAKQPWFVRPAEVVMLTLSFFLAAYLVGGGAQEARAPQVALAAILPASGPVPARVIEVWAPAAGTPAATPETVAAAPGEAEAGPAPAPRGDAVASAAPEPAAGQAPAPAAAAEPQPAPAPRADVAPEAPAATPAVAPPAASLPPLSYAQVIAFAIEAGWPAELADAVARVAWCESRFRPDAVGYGTYGLMQVVPLWFEYAGISFDHWADPVANLKAALAAYRYSEGQGHRPWAAWGCKPDAVVIP